mgnify:CR=1 FL=1
MCFEIIKKSSYAYDLAFEIGLNSIPTNDQWKEVNPYTIEHSCHTNKKEIIRTS